MLLFSILSLQAVPTDSLKAPAKVIDHTIRTMLTTPLDQLISTGIDYTIKLGIKILAAFIIYIIGAWLIRKGKKILRKVFDKKGIEASLSSFLLSVVSITFSVLLIVTTISVLGVDTTSFVALLAGSGLAIGMALSGTLQNFAGGIMILMFKPFKIGDYIEAQGFGGTVLSIEITTTHITTADRKTIILPNGALSNGSINNFSTSGTRRCEWNIGISYGDDVAKAKELILNIINNHPVVINTPAVPFAALSSLGDSAVIITARAWVNSDDYWTLVYDVNESIYNELPKNGINFPFPQMDVHVTQNN
ncbi:MAG: mechanosensitive ion channel [Bacteroidales bacterium]